MECRKMTESVWVGQPAWMTALCFTPDLRWGSALGCIFCDCDQIYAWLALKLLLGCVWLAGCQMTTLAVVSLISFLDTHQLELDNLTLLQPCLLNAQWILIISSGKTKQSSREWRGWMGLMQERYSFCHLDVFVFLSQMITDQMLCAKFAGKL